MGYVGWIGTFQGKKGTGKERVYESEMVRELRELGAVLYCKTSVPHTLMSGETVNNIIEYTTNPKNRNLSSGGSSGGEGALIGLKGSPVGFGMRFVPFLTPLCNSLVSNLMFSAPLYLAWGEEIRFLLPSKTGRKALTIECDRNGHWW